MENKKYPLELNTMPGFAGSSAYYLRYEDPKNDEALVSKEANDYWGNVDLYLGGSEHATGHLIYSRFWNKFLYDLGVVKDDEPFKKLINQGMIQGRSNFVYRINNNSLTPIHLLAFAEKILNSNSVLSKRSNKYEFVKGKIIENSLINEDSKKIIIFRVNNSKNRLERYINEYEENNYKILFLTKKKLIDFKFLIYDFCNSKEKYENNSKNINNVFCVSAFKDIFPTTEIHVDVNIVSNDILDIEKFKNWRPEFADAEFILENDKYVCGYAVEKMSKSMFNVVNPDDIVEKYGADTLRLYEMFLGPLEFSKPWDTNGIDGVHRFLKKLWGLVYKDDNLLLNNDEPTAEELKILHRTIKKIAYDIENFSFNTSVSAFMICVNELSALKCSKRAIIEPLSIILAPFAPHIAEEIYHLCVNGTSVCDAKFPDFDEKYLVENSVKYPISFNGKVRFTLELPANLDAKEVEKIALENEQTPKWLEGKEIKKIIVVPKKIVNIVF
jgi:leucyl-tRNA synthetase